MLYLFICNDYWTVILLNEGFVFFDRETRSTLWKYLNINIPWMNVEVWETSTVSKPVFSQGYAINTSLSCAPIWSGFGPKIRWHLICETSGFLGVNECMVWDCEFVVFSSNWFLLYLRNSTPIKKESPFLCKVVCNVVWAG